MKLLIRWLLSFSMPLCATHGADGIAPPGVVDFAHFQRAVHSTALLAPAGLIPGADAASPVFDVPASTLFAAEVKGTENLPRSYVLDMAPQALQAAFVIRSAVANFPDIVEIAAIPEGPGKSAYVFYSHALYGVSDYGVNARRAKVWRDAIQRELNK
jgi:hypothetical protein